jgi:hypothetical protein
MIKGDGMKVKRERGPCGNEKEKESKPLKSLRK